MGRPLRIDCAGGCCFCDRTWQCAPGHLTGRGGPVEVFGVSPAQSDPFGLRPWRYVLMDNHCHQGLETTEPNLSRAMLWQCELQRLVQATVPSCRTSVFRDASRRCCGSGGNGDWSSGATCIPSEI